MNAAAQTHDSKNCLVEIIVTQLPKHTPGFTQSKIAFGGMAATGGGVNDGLAYCQKLPPRMALQERSVAPALQLLQNFCQTYQRSPLY
jgi:hypothetical protein